ncbi:MAG: MscL family protein [Pseudomonadota bacterium]
MALFTDFRKFATRGDLTNMAIGFSVGAAFATFAKSLVDDILMPPVALVTGRVKFDDKFVLLEAGDPAGPYQTLEAARAAGAITWNYGAFLTTFIALALTALAMFLVLRGVKAAEEQLDEALDDDSPKDTEPADKKCPYCRTTIAYRATRCPQCTSRLEPVPGTEKIAASVAAS